jgi:hypothetical protein
MSRVIQRFPGLAALSVSLLAHFGTAALALRASMPTSSHTVVLESPDHWSGEVDVVVEPTSPPAAVAAPAPASPDVTAPLAPTPPKRTHVLAEHRPVAPPSGTAGTTVAATARTAGGADGVSKNRRSLARAFTRALPMANTTDPVWDELPLGDAGSIVVDLSLDDDGAIAHLAPRDRPRAPAYLERSAARALLLLHGDRFTPTTPGASTEAFRLDVVISARAPESGPLALGYEAPSLDKPGRAYFLLQSGRFVELKVSVVTGPSVRQRRRSPAG